MKSALICGLLVFSSWAFASEIRPLSSEISVDEVVRFQRQIDRIINFKVPKISEKQPVEIWSAPVREHPTPLFNRDLGFELLIEFLESYVHKNSFSTILSEQGGLPAIECLEVKRRFMTANRFLKQIEFYSKEINEKIEARSDSDEFDELILFVNQKIELINKLNHKIEEVFPLSVFSQKNWIMSFHWPISFGFGSSGRVVKVFLSKYSVSGFLWEAGEGVLSLGYTDLPSGLGKSVVYRRRVSLTEYCMNPMDLNFEGSLLIERKVDTGFSDVYVNGNLVETSWRLVRRKTLPIKFSGKIR